jgi:imidazolonepropionase-like amidohydrolase
MRHVMQIRNPKTEIRKKPEIRGPNSRRFSNRIGLRVSAFGFLSDFGFRISGFLSALLVIFLIAPFGHADTLLLTNAVVHTVSGATLTNGSVLIDGGKIALVADSAHPLAATATKTLDLQGRHLYPGLIAVDTVLGLTEIEAVRATQDTTEVGDYTPDVESWIAVNPDSELLPVARVNGIAYFEPVPLGKIVSGQSALMAIDGWTSEQMVVQKPVALHVFWPSMGLDTTPKERANDPSKWKSLTDQAKDRRARLTGLADFFDEARAYAKARDAATHGHAAAPRVVPAWEAMMPYVRGELPIVVHADDVREIRSAVAWAATNHYRMFIAGGQDAGMVADLLASNQIPVIFDKLLEQPVRDTDAYDTQFAMPAVLHRAGVRVIFSLGPSSINATLARNLPYVAAQAIAFGLPEDEALKGVTLYPAQLMGVADRLGSIEAGKLATLFVCDGDIFDIRANVKQMWIAGHDINLETRHTRLYEKYRNRPRPQ